MAEDAAFNGCLGKIGVTENVESGVWDRGVAIVKVRVGSTGGGDGGGKSFGFKDEVRTGVVGFGGGGGVFVLRGGVGRG